MELRIISPHFRALRSDRGIMQARYSIALSVILLEILLSV